MKARRNATARCNPALQRVIACVALFALGTLLGCAPVVPLRSKPGGAARWAYGLASTEAVRWSQDARACRVLGVGIGDEGWLPDRGGQWTVTFWSASKETALNVIVDTDGNVSRQEIDDPAVRESRLPSDWSDSPRAWAATRAAQQGEPMSTLQAELSGLAEPERYPQQVVWRIRFITRGGGSETHVVSASGDWLTRY